MLNNIKEEIEKRSTSQDIAVFDFDNTCIHNDIEDAVVRYLSKNNLWKKNKTTQAFDVDSTLLLNHYNALVRHEYEADCFLSRALEGFSKDELRKITLNTIENDKQLKPRKEIQEIMQALQAKGVVCHIVSASPQVIVETAAKYFYPGIPTIGVKSKHENNVSTGQVIDPISSCQGKVDCIKKYIKDQAPLLVAGDSKGDREMLEWAKIKVVINRNTPFSEHAKKQNWFII